MVRGECYARKVHWPHTSWSMYCNTSRHTCERGFSEFYGFVYQYHGIWNIFNVWEMISSLFHCLAGRISHKSQQIPGQRSWKNEIIRWHWPGWATHACTCTVMTASWTNQLIWALTEISDICPICILFFFIRDLIYASSIQNVWLDFKME